MADDLLTNLRLMGGTGCMAAAEITRLRTALAASEAKAAELTSDMEALVLERLDELDAEAAAFDKECWNSLRTLCENQPGFDWRDFDNEMTADDAYQYLSECFSASDDARSRAESALAASEKDNARLRRALDIARERLDTWVATYASELCDHEQVALAVNRIMDGGGHLAYIAEANRIINEALAATERLEGMVCMPREPDVAAMHTAAVTANLIPPDLSMSAVRDICRHYHSALAATERLEGYVLADRNLMDWLMKQPGNLQCTCDHFNHPGDTCGYCEIRAMLAAHTGESLSESVMEETARRAGEAAKYVQDAAAPEEEDLRRIYRDRTGESDQ